MVVSAVRCFSGKPAVKVSRPWKGMKGKVDSALQKLKSVRRTLSPL